MIDQLIISVMIALTAVFMTTYNDPYQWVLKKIKLDRPPFNCKVCFAWWTGIAYSILVYSSPVSLMIAPASAMLAIYLDKVINNESLKALKFMD
ncbi:hypothetical protein [Sphingobacterium mizutaii]|uniref:hypothetical protein n=1 Tax=Sphingobacterium mizutaii TaxID=1010 RepID=UPI0016239412|nr:hypothetical protein [Sphingobacterium mizutaii]